MDSTEDEMNVYLKVIKTVALKVKRSETTKKLKALFHEEEGSPENLQELFFTGKQLQDDHKLVGYGIQMNSTLHLFLQTIDRLKLLVYIPSNAKQFEVEAKSCETVENIKLLIQTKEGILSDQFTLFTSGKLLEENRTLASLNIRSELILIWFSTQDVMSAFVKLPNGEILNPEVKVLHTIRDVKAVIRSFVCFVDIDEQNLTYAGKLLENSKTLAYYDIKENSLLEMLPFTYQIFLMDLDGKTHFLRVCKEDRVRDVKSNILHWFGVPVHCCNLAYAGKILKDDEDLATYHIVKHSHLHVVFRGSIPKFVQISL